MKTPQAVKDAASFLTDMYPTKLYHIGGYDGYEVFGIRFLEDPAPCVGFPSVFLYKEGEKVKVVTDPDVFEIIDAAKRSTRERRKAAKKEKDTVR
jgi:hypothetical protein